MTSNEFADHVPCLLCWMW